MSWVAPFGTSVRKVICCRVRIPGINHRDCCSDWKLLIECKRPYGNEAGSNKRISEVWRTFWNGHVRNLLNRLKEGWENWIYANRKPVPVGIPFPGLNTSDRDLAMTVKKEANRSLKEARGPYDCKVHLLPPQWRMVFTLVTLDNEVCNGGFHQFFTNAGGIYDAFLLTDLIALGETPFRQIITAAFEEYRKLDYRSQWENRGKSWEFFTAAYKDGRFRAQEKIYFQTKPSLVDLVGKYIRRNFELYKQDQGKLRS